MVEQGVFLPKVVSPNQPWQLSAALSVEAVAVPHRAELSDMHAFILRGPERSLLFLPDHDRWDATLAHHGASSIRDWLSRMNVDVALIDGCLLYTSPSPRD